MTSLVAIDVTVLLLISGLTSWGLQCECRQRRGMTRSMWRGRSWASMGHILLNFFKRRSGQRGPSSTELLGLGLGDAWAIGVFVVSGQVASDETGPAATVALVIGAATAFLSALCYAEFVTREPGYPGSLYSCAHQSAGALAAFLLGWLTVLSHVSALAACSRSLSATIDYITGSRLKDFVEEKFGTLPLLGTRPDFLAVGVAAVPTLLFMLGLEHSTLLSVGLNVSVAASVFFFLVVGSLQADPENWVQHEFFPSGLSGLVTGAALCCSGFLGFYSVAAAGKLQEQPRRVIPRMSTVAIFFCFLTYFGISTVLTMMAPFKSLSEEVPLVQVFELRDVDWARLVMASLGIMSLSLSLVEISHPLHRLVHCMAVDGLLYRNLTREHPRTGTPALAILGFGLLGATMALLFQLRSLLLLMSTGVLLVQAVVSVVVLNERYQPGDEVEARAGFEGVRYKRLRVSREERNQMTVKCLKTGFSCLPAAIRLSSVLTTDQDKPPDDSVTLELDSEPLLATETEEDAVSSSSEESTGYESDTSTDIDAIVAEYKEKLRVATLTGRNPQGGGALQTEPSPATGRRVSLAVGGLVLCLMTLGIALCYGDGAYLSAGIMGGSVLLVAFLLLVVIARQPQRSRKDAFLLPLMPWTAALGLTLNITMFLHILRHSWAPFLIWIAIGCLVYFTHGRKGNDTKSRQQRIHMDLPPRQSIVSTLIPSHRRLPDESMRRLTQVDTILISR